MHRQGPANKNIDGVTNKDNVSVYSACSIKVFATNSEKITPFSEDDGFIVCNDKSSGILMISSSS